MTSKYIQVTPDDVRSALNDISEEELSTNTINQKIQDGEYFADNKNLTGYEKTKFVRAYAALKSFVVSNTYTRADFGDISVQRDWSRILRELENELKEVAEDMLVVDDTPMFDDRPSKKLENGEFVTRR